MDKQFKDAGFILVVCTETYCRRFEGHEEQGKGLGVKWEGAIITGELYRDETINKRFIPVVFAADDAAHVLGDSGLGRKPGRDEDPPYAEGAEIFLAILPSVSVFAKLCSRSNG
jgi:hypothetical protein